MNKSDPFERARAIRKGNLDNEIPAYDELTGWIQRVPITWIPGLLAQCVASAVIGDCFREDGLITFVKNAKASSENPNSILRKQ